jgi:hypothetical protein
MIVVCFLKVKSSRSLNTMASTHKYENKEQHIEISIGNTSLYQQRNTALHHHNSKTADKLPASLHLITYIKPGNCNFYNYNKSSLSFQLFLEISGYYREEISRKIPHDAVHTYIPLTLYPQRGSRGISDIPPRYPHFTKISQL